MAQNFPAAWGTPPRSAPYSRILSAPAVLTSQVDQAQCACSGMKLLITNTTNTFAYKDCTGATVTFPADFGAAEQVIDLDDVSAIEITACTGMSVLVYWHGSGSRL